MNKGNNSSAFLRGVFGLERVEQNGSTLNNFENKSYKDANTNYIENSEAKDLLQNTEVSSLVNASKEKLKNIPGLRHNLEQLVKFSAENLTFDEFKKSDNIAYQNAVLMYFQLYHFDTQLSIDKKEDLYVFAKLKAMNVQIPSTENHVVSQYTKAIDNTNIVTKNADGSISSVSKKIYQLPILAGESKTSSSEGGLTKRYPLRDAGYISFEFDANKGELKLIPIQPGYISQGYDSSIKIRALTQSGIDKFISSKETDQSKIKLEKDNFRDFTLDYANGILTITNGFADPNPDYSDVGQVRDQKKEKKKQNDIDVTKATWSYTADGRFIHHVKVKNPDDTKPRTDKELEFDIHGKIIDGQKITDNGKMLKNFNSSITTTEDTTETSILENQRTTVSSSGITLTEIKNQKNFNIIGDKLPEGRKLNIIESGNGKGATIDRIQIAKIGATSNGKFNHAIEFQSTTDKPNHHIIFPQLTSTASNGAPTEGDLTKWDETSIGFGAESDYKISIVNNTITVTKLNTEKLKKKTQDAIYDKLYKAIQNDKGGSKIQDYYKLGTEKGLNYDKSNFTVEMTRRVESLHSVYDDTKPEEQVLEEAIFKTNVYKDNSGSDTRSPVKGQYLEFNSTAELRSKGEQSTAQYLRLKNNNSPDYQLFKVAPQDNDLKITKENDNSNSMIEYLVSRLVIKNVAGQNVTFGTPKVEQTGDTIKINLIEGDKSNPIILSKDKTSKQRGPLKGTQLSLGLYYNYELGDDGSLTLTKGTGNDTIEKENKTKNAFHDILKSRGVNLSVSDSLDYDGKYLTLSDGADTYKTEPALTQSNPIRAIKVLPNQTSNNRKEVFLYIPEYCGALSNMIELNSDANTKLTSYLALGNTTNPHSLLTVDKANKTFTIGILGNDEFAQLADSDKYTELKTKKESREHLNFRATDYATISTFHTKINGIDGRINQEAKTKINELIIEKLFTNPNSDQKSFKDAILDPSKQYIGANEVEYMKEIEKIIGADAAFTNTISQEFIESYKTNIEKLSSNLTPTQRSEFLKKNKEHGFTFDSNGNISYLGNNAAGVTIDGVNYTIENSNGTWIKKTNNTSSDLFVKAPTATPTVTAPIAGGTVVAPTAPTEPTVTVVTTPTAAEPTVTVVTAPTAAEPTVTVVTAPTEVVTEAVTEAVEPNKWNIDNITLSNFEACCDKGMTQEVLYQYLCNGLGNQMFGEVLRNSLNSNDGALFKGKKNKGVDRLNILFHYILLVNPDLGKQIYNKAGKANIDGKIKSIWSYKNKEGSKVIPKNLKFTIEGLERKLNKLSGDDLIKATIKTMKNNAGSKITGAQRIPNTLNIIQKVNNKDNITF